MRSENWLIIELGAILAVFGILSFFKVPAYDKGAWFIAGVFASQFSNVIGYKFGKSMPQQSSDPKEGQVSSTEVTTKVSAVSDPAPPTT